MTLTVRSRIFGLVLGILAACQATQPQQVDAARNIELSPSVRQRTANYDVESYTLAIDLDPVQRSIEATCNIRLWPLVSRLSQVELDFDGLDVTTVRDRAGKDLKWSRIGGSLSIDLASPLEKGSFEEITVAYHGHPVRGLWFADEENGVPHQVFTHGECRDARAWFPCFDDPSERATSEIRVTMPRAWTSIAAGDRIGRAEDGERATETWRMTFPHPAYLETLVAGELQVETDKWEDVPLVYAAEPRFGLGLRVAFIETPAILDFFSQATSVRYPYTKYAQTCVDNFPFGGMENISATTMTDTMLSDVKAIADASPFGLVAHEAAHQWFGDLVTCRDWSHAWLNEGFATYFAALYTEKSRGAQAFRNEMRANRALYLARNVGKNRRPIVYGVADDPLELFFSGHVYQGGAICLHHLRTVLGDDAFFRGVQRYLSDHRGGSVVTDDLRVAMEQASGTDLRWFFDQWLYAPGFPEVSSSWSWNATDHEIDIALEQTQASENGTPAVYRLPIDVEIQDELGSRIEHVVMDRRRQRFTLSSVRAPTWVRIDPFDSVPMKLDESMLTRSWRAMARDAADAGGRLRALNVLARDASATEARYGQSQDHSVVLNYRASTAEKIARTRLDAKGSTSSEFGKKLLVQAAANDPDMNERAAAFEALKAFTPDAELAQFGRKELPRVESWKVRGAIAGLVAKAEPEVAFDWLVTQLDAGSLHGNYEAQVLSEIAATHDPRAVAILETWARDPSKPDAARASAVRELGRIEEDGAGRATLCDLLDSPRFRVRREALQVLGRLHDPRTRGALERFRAATNIDSERRAADDALARMSAGS